jgi:hypothetical protein
MANAGAGNGGVSGPAHGAPGKKEMLRLSLRVRYDGCGRCGDSDPRAGLALGHTATPRTPSRAERKARIGLAATQAEAPSRVGDRASQEAR